MIETQQETIERQAQEIAALKAALEESRFVDSLLQRTIDRTKVELESEYKKFNGLLSQLADARAQAAREAVDVVERYSARSKQLRDAAIRYRGTHTANGFQSDADAADEIAGQIVQHFGLTQGRQDAI